MIDNMNDELNTKENVELLYEVIKGLPKREKDIWNKQLKYFISL